MSRGTMQSGFRLWVAAVILVLGATDSRCQIERVELTDFSRPGKDRGNTWSIVQRDNTHIIVEFERSLRRYSLESGKEEAVVFDLTKILPVDGSGGPGRIYSSLDGSWLLFSHTDVGSGNNHYLFDSNIWECSEEVEPVAKWRTPDACFRNQILAEPKLVVVARHLGRRSELELRRLDASAEIVRRVMIPGNFSGCWWDAVKGLVVLGRQNIPASTVKLLKVDVESGRITRTTNWELPSQYGSVRPLRETAAVIFDAVDTERHLLRFGHPPTKLISRFDPMSQFTSMFSSNGRVCVDRAVQDPSRAYVLDLEKSRKIAEYESPDELPLAITNDGRFCVSAVTKYDGGERRKLVVREFK